MPPLNGNGSSLKNSSLLQSRQVKADISKIKHAKGQMKILVILMDFPDYRWNSQTDTLFNNDSLRYTPSHFDDMLNSNGTYRHPGSVSSFTGSFKDYYLENSYQGLDVSCDIVGYFTSINNFAYYCEGYGANDYYLIQEALDSADKYVDFSDYDNDGDGETDAIFFVHAGPGAEALPEPENEHYIWSYMSALSGSRDGVYLGAYSMQPEDGTIGVFCHEFGHQLGLPDWYDYDYSSNGVGEWCLMGGGGWCYKDRGDPMGSCPAHISAVGKYVLGWITPISPSENLYNVNLPPSENSSVAYLLQDATMPSNEYFIIENRQNMGFDEGLVRRQIDLSKQKAHGLVIWHIDENISNNNNELHKQVDVEEASPYYTGTAYYEHLDHIRSYPAYEKLYNGNRGDNGDAWPGYNSFSADSTDFTDRSADFFNIASHPSSKTYSSANTLIGVENIAENDTMITVDIFINVGNSISKPFTGEELINGTNFSIEWLSGAGAGIIFDSLYYNIKNGDWTPICRDTTTTNMYSWTVLDTISDSCRIKLVSSNSTGVKKTVYSGYFNIAGFSYIENSDKQYGDYEKTFSLRSVYYNTDQLKNDLKSNGYIVYDMTGSRISIPERNGKYFVSLKAGRIIKRIGSFLYIAK